MVLNKDKTKIQGCMILAKALKEQGVEFAFGIVGHPVIELGFCLQAAGIKYVGMRNEQAASYAAGAVGYLTGKPGLCIAVSGPGMIHAIAGLANAWANCWPMILVGGASDSNLDGCQAFQEAPQVAAAMPFCKYASRPTYIERIPFFVEKAYRTSIYGRPGACYLDMPAELLQGTIPADTSSLRFPLPCKPPPKFQADPAAIGEAVKLLQAAKNPLVIVGQGCNYANASEEVRELIERTHLPFLPTPKGKGAVPDDSPYSIAPARSLALREADVVVLLGGRLNWMLHFGWPPRFKKDVKVIQVDICPEEMSHSVPTEVALVGDAKAVIAQLNKAIAETGFSYPSSTPWWDSLKAGMAKNGEFVEKMSNDDSVPMNYYRVFKSIKNVIPRNAIIIGEGANTMDIGRTIMGNYNPKSRLDAGSFGTMGVGVGFAIAAALVHPDRPIVCVEGDSAIGFSAMELEVACRYKLPITFIVVNNNGIGTGVSKQQKTTETMLLRSPPPSLSIQARYDLMCEAFGGKGYFCDRPEQLDIALQSAMADTVPSLVNIAIDPRATRKPQKFGWLTEIKKDSKL